MVGIRRGLAVAVLVLGSGCGGKPVPIQDPYAILAPPRPLNQRVLLLPFVDGRGYVKGAVHGREVDLPDHVQTTATDFGTSTLYTTTVRDGGSATLYSGYTLGSDSVEQVGRDVIRSLGGMDRVGEHLLDGSQLVVDIGDASTVARACSRSDVNRAVLVVVEELEYQSNAHEVAFAWAYLLGGTLGLASPFIPLAKWNATLSARSSVYLYDTNGGYVKKRVIDRDYRTSGKGLPGWRRVFAGALPWDCLTSRQMSPRP